MSLISRTTSLSSRLTKKCRIIYFKNYCLAKITGSRGFISAPSIGEFSNVLSFRIIFLYEQKARCRFFLCLKLFLPHIFYHHLLQSSGRYWAGLCLNYPHTWLLNFL